tara:strand:+ start:348 stop:1019 length:672 start_codon:yes stop_codon:yes gene_type:complete
MTTVTPKFDLKKVTIYILKLSENKFYIGRSKKLTERGVRERINQQFQGESMTSAWCKKYPPIEVIDIIYKQNKHDENKWVKIYMDKYGIENVRGGDYASIELSTEQIKMLQTEIHGANDLCHKCGQVGHFMRSCPSASIDSQELYIVWACNICNKEYELEKDCELCELKHIQDKILHNLCRRFKLVHYREISDLCKQFNYHGGLVSKILRKRSNKLVLHNQNY